MGWVQCEKTAARGTGLPLGGTAQINNISLTKTLFVDIPALHRRLRAYLPFAAAGTKRMQKKQPSEQQIRALAVSFLPVIRAYFDTDEGREAYRKFLEEHPDCKNGSEKLSLDASENDSEKEKDKAL